jgi:BirA family biotin operon repressor/biotin-[acetyl-CoA-carboxylase] ligase
MSLNKIKELFKINNFDYFNLKSSESTMIDAKNHIEKGFKNFVIFADKQISGKGRRGNEWISPPGNLYCSIVFKNNLKLQEYYLFSMIVSLSVKSAIEIFTLKKIEFKWPNDIFFDKKKFAGMILESYQSQKKENFVIIGLGVNYLSSPIINGYKTTYIKNFLDINTLNDFVINFFISFFAFIKNIDSQSNKKIMKKFSKSLMYLEKKIKILNHDNTYIKGTFKGINNDGSLILDIDSKLISVYSGSIKI